MKYFLVLFVFGILCRNTLARGLNNPVLHDLERRLVRLEARQFSESENLEHRMLQLETQLGTQQGEDTLERSPVDTNVFEIIKVEKPSEVTTFLQRLEKVEKNWEKELEDQLTKFSSKYDSLSERFSAMEKHLEEKHSNATLNRIVERLSMSPEKPESAEAKSEDSESDDSESKELKKYELFPDNGESDAESSERLTEGSGSEPENDESAGKFSTKFRKIGSKYYFIENNERKPWSTALDTCKSMNAHLVSLQDEEEWSVLKKVLLPDHSYWVDINDIEDEGLFVSKTSGQMSPFLKWDNGEPNTSPGGEDCVELRSDHDFKMNDVTCWAEKYYICESNS